MKQKLTEVGRIGKTHGLQGELKLSIESGYEEDLLRQESIFITTGGHSLPYFIEHIRGKGSWLIKLEDINDKETASALQQAKVLLPADAVQQVGDTPETPYSAWVGYTISDEEMGVIGTIINIVDMPQHYLAVVSHNEREILIPLHENLIISTDTEQKTVQMRLPDGLLTL